MFCAKLGWRLLRRQWTDVINNAEADDPDASLVVFYLPLIALRQESSHRRVYAIFLALSCLEWNMPALLEYKEEFKNPLARK